MGRLVSVNSMPWRSLIKRTVSRIRLRVARPRKSILSSPIDSRIGYSYCVIFSVTADFGGRISGRIVDQRLVGHDDGRGMNRGVTGHSLQLAGRIKQLLDVVLALVQIAQLGRIELVALGQHFLDRDRLAGDRGDHLGDAVHFGQRDIHRPADIAHGGTRLHAAEGDDLRHLLRAELIHRIADQLFTLVVREVEVKIGHGDAARIEEALEDELVTQRIQVGDADRIGDDRAGARPAHVVPDVPLPGVTRQIPDDQIVNVETHLVDDLQLVLRACLHGRVIGTGCYSARAVLPRSELRR